MRPVTSARRCCLLLTVAVAVGGAITGCGSGSGVANDSPTTNDRTTPTVTTPARPATTEAFKPTQEHVWRLAPDSRTAPTTDTGQRLYDARVRVELALGTVTSVAKADVPAKFVRPLGACEVDSERDAIVPLQTTLRNDGPVPLKTNLALRVADLRTSPNEGDPMPVEAATVFASDGPSCQSLSEGQTSSLNYPGLMPDQSESQPYVLVLHNFFSPSYDSTGNRYGLRHLVGLIAGLGVQVAGNDAGNSIILDSTECYSGTSHQGVDGPGLPTNFNSVSPGFALADGDFDYSYQHLDADLAEPTGYDEC